MEMIAAIVYQLTRRLCTDEIKQSGFDSYFRPHHRHLPCFCFRCSLHHGLCGLQGDILTDA